MGGILDKPTQPFLNKRSNRTMAEMWEKRHRVAERHGWGQDAETVVKFRSMAMVSKQELIEYLNKPIRNINTKPKMKAKALKELTKRGVKLVWK